MKRTIKSESGRSMVEMLGVLAIIGVLSIGGIAGYTMAMNRFRANEVIDMANKYAALVFAQNQTSLARTGAALTTVPTLETLGLTTGDLEGNNLAGGGSLVVEPAGIVDDGVTVTINFTTEGVCEAAVNILGGVVAGERGTADNCAENGGSLTTFFRQS